MKLVQLTATNFMPYKGTIVLDFPTDETRNVMLVFGDNMRGKTSLMNALRWGFYGRAIGRHSRPILLHQIVNRDAIREDDWRIEVFIRFEANGHTYELRRAATRRLQVASPSRPEDFVTNLHLSRDGVVLSGDQVEAEINQFAPEQVSRFFLFDGELLQEYEELLIEGSEQGRQIKDAIEQVLGVPALIHGRDELGAILKTATKKQTNEMSHIQGLERQAQQIDELTARLESYEGDQNSLQDRLNNTRDDRAKLVEELDAAASVLAQKSALDSAKKTIETLTDVRDRRLAERKDILASAWLDLLQPKLDLKRDLLRLRQKDLTNSIKDRAVLQAGIDNIQQLLDTSTCPTCEQALGQERRADLGARLGDLEARLNEIGDSTAQIQEVSAQLASLEKIRGVQARRRLAEIEKDLRKTEVEIQRAENEVETISDKIAGYDTAELSLKRRRSDELLKEEGRISQDLKLVRASIDKTKDDLAIARKAAESLAPARHRRSTLKTSLTSGLERIFSASIEQLRDKLRKRVETLASESFMRMTTQKAYRGLEINENYGLSIIDSSGNKVSLRSAGAEQIVALSLIDGLNRTGRAIGPVVMDTPFGRLDPKHRDNVLAYLSEVTSQFVLLVHGGEIRPETDLVSIKPRIGAVYTISEVSETVSRVERTSL